MLRSGSGTMQAGENEEAAGRETLRAVVGATASGKTALAVELCLALERGSAARQDLIGEVVSMDSMLVYRGLDLGTAKPSLEERRGVPHHLIDHVDPAARYDVASYSGDAAAVEEDCRARGVQPIYCGGTAFYLQALLFGLSHGPDVDQALRAALNERYDQDGAEVSHAKLVRVDPVLAARVHPNDKKRVVRGLEVFEQTGRPLSATETSWKPEDRSRPAQLVLLESEPEELDARIEARTRAMFAAGWPDEAARLWEQLGPTARAALGYREALAVSRGELELEAAIERVTLATRQFARRQRTWLRRFQALGCVRSFPAPQTTEDLERLALEVLDTWFEET